MNPELLAQAEKGVLERILASLNFTGNIELTLLLAGLAACIGGGIYYIRGSAYNHINRANTPYRNP